MKSYVVMRVQVINTSDKRQTLASIPEIEESTYEYDSTVSIDEDMFGPQEESIWDWDEQCVTSDQVRKAQVIQNTPNKKPKLEKVREYDREEGLVMAMSCLETGIPECSNFDDGYCNENCVSKMTYVADEMTCTHDGTFVNDLVGNFGVIANPECRIENWWNKPAQYDEMSLVSTDGKPALTMRKLFCLLLMDINTKASMTAHFIVTPVRHIIWTKTLMGCMIQYNFTRSSEV